MSGVIQVQRGTTAIRTFETLSRADGSRVAPSALPTVASVHINGIINSSITPTIIQNQDATPANITGYYRIEFSTNSLNANDDVDITISATISGTTVLQVMRFLVIDQPSLIPIIR